MMSGMILEELQTVGTAFLSGAYITIVYDGLRILRRVVIHGNFWIGVEDFIFWIWTAFWIFSVIYRENDGSLRMYTILAMAVGMIVYHLTISEFLVETIGKLLKKIIHMLYFPMKMVKKLILFFLKLLKSFINGIIIKLLHSR